MPMCSECHHQPSDRTADYGATCQCKCHDAADAGPDLLAAAKELFNTLTGVNTEALQAWADLEAAIVKAEGVTNAAG